MGMQQWNANEIDSCSVFLIGRMLFADNCIYFLAGFDRKTHGLPKTFYFWAELIPKKNNDMKSLHFSLIQKMSTIFLLLLITSSCDQFLDRVVGSGNRAVEERQPGTFNAIEAGSNFAISLEKGDMHKITIEADDNLFPFIVSELRGKTLKLYSDAQLKMKGRVEVHIVYNELNSISLSGAAKLNAADTLQSQRFAFELSGASKAEASVLTGNLDAKLSGASKLYLDGNADQMQLKLSGASLVQAKELESADCNIRASGSSKATVFVNEKLSVKASGSSAIRYVGNPESVQQSLSGASTLKPY